MKVRVVVLAIAYNAVVMAMTTIGLNSNSLLHSWTNSHLLYKITKKIAARRMVRDAGFADPQVMQKL